MGGGRAKKQGNKHSGGGSEGGGGGQYAGVRRAGEGEAYAVAVRVYGGGRAQVIGNDGLRRRLEIRGKFKGRNRRYNEVKAGSLLLVGDRQWSLKSGETNTNSAKQERVCDLLCVYDADETRLLKREGKLQMSMFKEAASKFDDTVDEGISFDNTGGTRRREQAVEPEDEEDPYAGMPSFSDDEAAEETAEASDDGAGAVGEDWDAVPVPASGPAGEPASGPPAGEPKRGQLWDDDEEVDPDDI